MVFTRPCYRTLIGINHFFQKAFPGGFIGWIFSSPSQDFDYSLLIDEFARKKNRLPGILETALLPDRTTPCLYGLGRDAFTFMVQRDYVAGIGTLIAAVFGFVTNFFEMATGGSYESNFIPHLFLHTWVLALEVHYYVLWALLAWFLAKRAKGRKVPRHALPGIQRALSLHLLVHVHPRLSDG